MKRKFKVLGANWFFPVPLFFFIFLGFLFLPAFAVSPVCADEPGLVLLNADFQEWDEVHSVPKAWRNDSVTLSEALPDGGVKLTIAREQTNHAAMSQNLKIPAELAEADFILSGTLCGSEERAAYLSIKFFKDCKELRRLGSDSVGQTPRRVSVRFSPEGADSIEIICRLPAKPGLWATFSDLKLETVPADQLGDWTMTCGSGKIKPLNEARNEISVHLISAEGERFASVGKDFRVSQRVTLPKISPSENFEFSAKIESDFVDFGWLNVEIFQNGELVQTLKSPRNVHGSDVCRIVFGKEALPPAANGPIRVDLSFCFDGRQKFFGEHVKLSEIYFGPERKNPPKAKAPAPELELVPGFQVASVYLHHCAEKPESVDLKFRRISSEKKKTKTQNALEPVWYKEERNLRGSLVNLKEDSEYEVQLKVSVDGTEKVYKGRFRTQSGKVKIWKTIELTPENCAKFPFKPKENGSVEKGFICYTAKPGFVLDAGESADAAIQLTENQYVLFDGLTIRGGRRDAIQLTDCRNVRILNCDIADYGRIGVQRPDLDGKFFMPGDDRHGINNDCGVRIDGCNSVLVERCFVHDPRGTANSWFYSHPAGPNAVFVGNSTGVCLRWNDFIGSDLHRWNDTVEGMANGLNSGSVRRDAEICGNYLAFGNDDGMELDGGQVNCRFLMNRTEGHLCGVSTAPCKRGPSYLWRNVFCNPGDVYGLVGVGFKNNFQNIGAGTTFFIQNSILGYSTAFSSPGGTPEEYASYADWPEKPFKGFGRNNLAQGGSAVSSQFFQNLRSDFDWNLYSPRCEKELTDLRSKGQEEHSQLADASFLNAAGGVYALADDSAGKGAGTFVPNFMPRENPDLGALPADDPIDAIPYRPAPFKTDVMHVDFTSEETFNETEKIVRLTAQKTTDFRIVQPDAARFFRVRPSSGTIREGETVELRVTIRPKQITHARKNSSAFSIRTPDGLSRPVSVMADSRGNAELVKQDQEGAIFGTVTDGPEKDAVTLTFDVPRDGSYWLFASGQRGDCQWRELVIDGGEPLERINIGPSTPENVWWCVAAPTFHGKPNQPFVLKAGKHQFILRTKSSWRALKISAAALCESPENLF